MAVFLTGEWCVANKLVVQPVATGGQPYQPGNSTSGVMPEVRQPPPPMAALLGREPKYGWRLKQIAPLALEALESCIAEFHRVGKEATLTERCT